jgi:glycosyltransferase involved in cell wall biosynthesis
MNEILDRIQAAPVATEGTRVRVGIELRSAVRGASGGLVAVLTGTLHQLFRRRPDIAFIVFCTPFNRHLLATEAANVELVTLPLDGFFSELDAVARDRQLDVIFRSFPTVEELEFPLERQIFLVPDVLLEYHPEFFDVQTLQQRKRAFRIAFDGAGAIATLSEHARRAIKRRAWGTRDIFVMSPGVPTEFETATSAAATPEERALIPESDFFLFPANLWPSKNHERLLQAFGIVCERTDKSIELVLTGALTGWNELLGRHPHLPVRHLGYVSPALLRMLYERASALTFFSLYEGFGIPLLEAFSVGTPVVCGNRGSVPEVVGDAALMCNPTDVGAMSGLMMQIIGDAALRRRLVARGEERLRKFTWSAAADQLAGGIHRVLTRDSSDSRAGRRLRHLSSNLDLGSLRMWWVSRHGSPPAPELRPLAGRPYVVGYWSDNWLDPTLEIVLGPNAVQGPLRLEGIPVGDMTLTVALDGHAVRQVELRKGIYEIIEIDSARASGDVISFSFSERIQDGERREISFLLQATNIFAEENLQTRVPFADDEVLPEQTKLLDADSESP